MNKPEWDAMETWEKDELVWTTFPEIPAMREDWILSTDGGKTAFTAYKTELAAKRALLALKAIGKTDSRYGAQVFPWRYPRGFTTDRNACALVLKEVGERGKAKDFMLHLGPIIHPLASPYAFPETWQELMGLLRVDPDAICYCALKAVTDAR